LLHLIPRRSLATGAGVRMLPCMDRTKQVPRAQWKEYFDRFTRERLKGDGAGGVTLEVISPLFGDQYEASAVRLLGLGYDPKSNDFEVSLEDVDHLIFDPAEIWVLEQEPGLIATIEIVEQDGSKQILYVRAGAPLGAGPDAPAPV